VLRASANTPPLLAAIATAVAVVALSGCASTKAPKSGFSGTLVYCSAIDYPPAEFYGGVTPRGRELRLRPVGVDIDIGSEVARQVGVKARFVNTEFDGIIAALLAKKCDAIISTMNDTAARRAQVDFVDYLSVGKSLMVKHGNPAGIQTLSDLSGKLVSVESGTTNEAFLHQESARLQRQGKAGMRVVTYSEDTDASGALKAGDVDAYFGDAPVVAYYVTHDSAFAVAGRPLDSGPVGIALRKGDTRIAKVRRAIDQMYADGKMKKILAKWRLSATALH